MRVENFLKNQNHTKRGNTKNFSAVSKKGKSFWFWQKIVIMYDNNILTVLFCILFCPSNWSGSFRLNDFDGWQEKGFWVFIFLYWARFQFSGYFEKVLLAFDICQKYSWTPFPYFRVNEQSFDIKRNLFKWNNGGIQR